MIYLDNAATTGKKPVAVINAVNNAMRHLTANPGRSGHDLSVKSAMEIYKCREVVKQLVNASSENNICFTLNCTHAINTVLHGMLNNGDHLIISSLEHNAVLRPAHQLSCERNIQYDIAQVDLFYDETTVDNIEKLIKPNTKLIFVTAASNVIGRKLPLERIGKLCKDRGILFGVDAAQAAGVIDLDVQKMNIDFLCIAPHKGLYAPMGTGILVAEKNIDRILISGGTGVNSIEITQPEDMPERVESGTLNVSGIAGIRAGVDFVSNKGISQIEEHEMRLTQYLYKQLKRLGAELYTPFPYRKRFAPVLSFNVRELTSEKVGEFLNKNQIAVRTGLHCAPLAHKQIGTLERGTVRVAPSVFNSSEDIDKLIFVIKRLI